MAIKKVYELSVDLKKTTTRVNIPVLVQGDSAEFRIRLLDNGAELSTEQLTGITKVSMQSGYDAQTVIQTVGTLQGSVAVFRLKKNELFRSGTVQAMVQLEDSADRISTLRFQYQVIADLSGNYIPGEQDLTIFQRYMNDAQAKIDEMAATDVAQLTVKLAETDEILTDTAKYSYPSVNDHLYNFDKGLSKWFAALASFRTNSSRTINVSVIGDSISEGNAAGNMTASQYFEKGYLGQLKTKFNSRFGNAGRGFIPVYLTTNAPMWSFDGFVHESGYFGATGFSRMSQANGNTATLTFNGTGVGIVFPKRSNGGSLSVSIDGGAPVVINTYSATEVLAERHEITGLSNGAHTMVITSVITGAQKVWVFGAYEITAATGIRFNMVGRSGVTTSGVSTNPAMPTEIDVWKPTLTIIPLTANDYGGQVALSVYETNLQNLITRAKPFGDVLLVSVGLQVPVVNETIPQIEYVKVQKKLAELNDVAFMDMFHLWSGNGSLAKNTLGFIHDHVHPTDSGHADIADKLYGVLTKNVNHQEVFAKKITIEDKGVLSASVSGNGHYKKISKAFGHRQETTAKDLIVFDHSPPSSNGDSSTVFGKIRVVFGGRNTGGANAHCAIEYDFYYDNKNNLTLTQKSTHSVDVSTTTATMTLARKGTENVIQLTLTPNKNSLTGSVFAEVDYIQAFILEPITVKFADSLV